MSCQQIGPGAMFVLMTLAMMMINMGHSNGEDYDDDDDDVYYY